MSGAAGGSPSGPAVELLRVAENRTEMVNSSYKPIRAPTTYFFPWNSSSKTYTIGAAEGSMCNRDIRCARLCPKSG